jgi:hypothetical protein
VATHARRHMQDNSTPLQTVTVGSEAAEGRPSRREKTAVIDSVKVDPHTFDSVIFLGSEERKEYVEGQNIPHNQKKQKYNKDGVPVWSVKLYATTWRGLERQVKVNVASPDDPAERLSKGELVALSDVEFGVTPKREGGGYTVWLNAGGIQSTDTAVADMRKRAGAAATSAA